VRVEMEENFDSEADKIGALAGFRYFRFVATLGGVRRGLRAA
jgi:hypothetical protein